MLSNIKPNLGFANLEAGIRLSKNPRLQTLSVPDLSIHSQSGKVHEWVLPIQFLPLCNNHPGSQLVCNCFVLQGDFRASGVLWTETPCTSGSTEKRAVRFVYGYGGNLLRLEIYFLLLQESICLLWSQNLFSHLLNLIS
jgi:hypothetical protein